MFANVAVSVSADFYPKEFTMSANDRYPNILQPLDIGATRVSHRIMVTGHTQLYGRDETLSERHIAYYRERAKGGADIGFADQHDVIEIMLEMSEREFARADR